MSRFSPESIAALASRIYNEKPGTNGNGHGTGAVHETPGAPPPSDPPVPDGMSTAPGFPPALVTSYAPDSIHSALAGAARPSVPSEPPQTIGGTSAIPAAALAARRRAPGGENVTHSSDVSSGVQRFVQLVRTTGLQSPAMSLPGLAPVTPTAMAPGFSPPLTSTTPFSPNSAVPGVPAVAAPTPHSPFGAPSASLPQLAPIASPTSIPISGARPLDVNAIRADFPVLRQMVHGRPLAWLDNAATTQKPQSVIDAISHFYSNDNSNIHRGAHTLAARATDAFENARQTVQRFIGASSPQEIIFVRGTTEGINLVAQTFGRKFLQPGDEIILTTLEHHANIVPWQMIARERGARILVVPVNDNGEIILERYEALLGERTRLVALTHASNSLGTIVPIEQMTQMARRHNARVLIDGAQTVAHVPVNVRQLDADFFVFSGHKIFGPTGIGAVFAKRELQEIMPPWQGGGNMIKNVTFEETTYADPPAKFEAGTPTIADAVGLGAALDYVSRLGLPNIAAYEHHLLDYATQQIGQIPGVRLIGTAKEKIGVLSFVLPERPTEEVGRALDQEGIAVRAGHHCSQPSLRRFGVESTVRPSFAFYNTCEEIDRLAAAVRRILRK